MGFKGASATVTNNSIRSNGTKGIIVYGSGNARIGITDLAGYGQNFIENNVEEGVMITTGSNAFLLKNDIKNNGQGTNRPGIGIYRGTCDLIGDNTIQGNAGHGISISQGSLFQGVGDWNLTPGPDIIKENTLSGILASNGSSLDVQYATIKDNTQHGISLSTRSILRIYNSTVSGNTLNGIGVYYGSAARFGTPAASVTGNTGWGLFCGDNEASYDGDTSGVVGNAGGQVSCTGF